MFSLKRQQGAGFEHQARLFLETKGLKFITANQYFKCGELDLIMQDGQTIVLLKYVNDPARHLDPLLKVWIGKSNKNG